MGDYQHYVRVSGGVVVHGFSTAFEQPEPGDICINDDAQRHFQIPLVNDKGQYLYKWTKGKMVLRSASELANELAAEEPAPPSELEILKQRVDELEAQVRSRGSNDV